MTRVLVILQALLSVVTAVTLIVSPASIPATVGVVVDPRAFLLCYLIGANELSLAFLSILATRSQSESTRGTLTVYSIFFHSCSGIAGLYAIATGLPSLILANVVPHFIVAILFAFALYRDIMRRTLHMMGC